MYITTDVITAELRLLIADLGRDGALVSASVYDTARMLSLAPPPSGSDAGLDWLMKQRQADGGWGDPSWPARSRDVSTLAALLALRALHTADARAAIRQGLQFLRAHEPHWSELPDDLPVGIEVTLPLLLTEAKALGWLESTTPYTRLFELGERRRGLLARAEPSSRTAPAHVWDGWGTNPDPAWVDPSGGVGHSPAATATWLNAAEGRSSLQGAIEAARSYLDRASRATGTGVPGVVPTVWPLDRMEQQWGLLALLGAGLLMDPRLSDAVDPQLDALAAAMQPRGIGMSDHFMEDGDCTATTVALLHAAGRPSGAEVVRRFADDDRFFTYPGELQPSVTTTAHCVLALKAAGDDLSRPIRFLIDRQLPDGRWSCDKWQTSWLYVTSQVVLALAAIEDRRPVERAREAILREQRPDGGWGHGREPTAVETAFAVSALLALQRDGGDDAQQRALLRARQWLLRSYRPFSPVASISWIGKELYCPFRVDRAFELAAMLALASLPG